MADSFLEVPVVSHELTPAETYQQLYKSLEVFKAKSDAVFDRVAKRIHVERQLLQGLAGRVELAQSKIDAITGSCKATTLLSRPRYPDPPASAANGEFDLLWSHSQEALPWQPQHMPRSPPRGNWKSAPRGAEESLELFAFFTDTAHELTLQRNMPPGSSKMGLGRTAGTIQSAADLLLFNSMAVPQLRHTVVDNLKSNVNQSRRPPRVDADETVPHLPPSIFDAERSQHGTGTDDFVFRPRLGDVPSFSLPSILPDLPRIADINWTGSLGGAADLPSIAPSASLGGGAVANYPASSSKPAVNAPSPPQSTGPPLSSTSSRPASSSSQRAPSEASGSSRTSSQPPSPLSVPRQALPTLHAAPSPTPNVPTFRPPPYTMPTSATPPELPDVTLSSKAAAADILPPPPPPPPPPPMPPLPPPQRAYQPLPPPQGIPSLRRPSGDMVDSGMAPPPPLPQLDSVRSALMESIRNPSIRLRKTPSAGPSGGGGGRGAPTRSQSMAPASGSTSFLAEMASSLHMRRLSMQGHATASTASLNDPEPQGSSAVRGLGSMTSETQVLQSAEDHSLLDPRKRFQQLPIAHVHDYIKRTSQASSAQDDDWDSD